MALVASYFSIIQYKVYISRRLNDISLALHADNLGSISSVDKNFCFSLTDSFLFLTVTTKPSSLITLFDSVFVCVHFQNAVDIKRSHTGYTLRTVIKSRFQR